MEESNGVGKPSLPKIFFKLPVTARLKAVQQFISSFGYKQGTQTSFNVCKARPLSRIMDTARLMIERPQPIKCVEAVFLALYLTAGIHEVERIPVSFKSQFNEQVYQHIVLLVRHGGKYGAFGISRQPDLMDKELQFNSISSIIGDYKKAYESASHVVLRIRVGLPVEHALDSFNYVCWRFISLDMCSLSWEQCCEALEKHAAQAKKLWERWLIEGQKGCYKGHDNSRKSIGFGSDMSADEMPKCKNDERTAKMKPAKRLLSVPALEKIVPLLGSRCVHSRQRISVSKAVSKHLEISSPNNAKMLEIQIPNKVKRNGKEREVQLSSLKYVKKCRSFRGGLSTPKLTGIHKFAARRVPLKCYTIDLSNQVRNLPRQNENRSKILSL